MRIVPLLKGSHGTHDYYGWRAVLGRRVIDE
jgi:hypothetical protein